MAFNLVFRDDFNRSNTVVGGVNSTSGVGNGWLDVFGSTWAIENNKLKAFTSEISKPDYLRYLTRGSASIDQQVIFNWEPTNIYTNIYLRANTTSDTLYYFQVFPVASGASKIVIGYIINGIAVALTEQTFTYASGNTYEITGSVENVSPTTLKMSCKNTTTGVVSAFITISNSTSGLQQAGVMALSAVTAPCSFDYFEYYDSNLLSIVPGTHSNLTFSPYNWHLSNNVAITNNPGAYLNCTFSGSAIELVVDVSSFVSLASPSNSYPKITWSVDDKTWQTLTLSSSNNTIVLESGLSNTPHNLKLYFLGIDYTLNRWTTTVGFLKIVKFNVGSIPNSSPLTKAKKAVIFGDSMTEGLAIDSSSPITGNKSVFSYSALLGEGLNAEYGQIGFGGQGYTVGGTGNTPPFLDSWDKYSSVASRLIDGKLSPLPDYLVVVHGTNDALSNPAIADDTLTSAVRNLLPSLRFAAGNDCEIVVVIPFGAFYSGAITAAVNNYQQQSGDLKTKLVDLGLDGSRGISSFALGSSHFSTDGIHPSQYNHSRLAAKLLSQLSKSVSTISFPSTGQRLPRR